MTSYLDEHPGGRDILKSVSGKDATQQFRDVGHSQNAYQRRESFLIGEVDDSGFFKWHWWYVPIIVTGVMYYLNKAGRGISSRAAI